MIVMHIKLWIEWTIWNRNNRSMCIPAIALFCHLIVYQRPREMPTRFDEENISSAGIENSFEISRERQREKERKSERKKRKEWRRTKVSRELMLYIVFQQEPACICICVCANDMAFSGSSFNYRLINSHTEVVYLRNCLLFIANSFNCVCI